MLPLCFGYANGGIAQCIDYSARWAEPPAQTASHTSIAIDNVALLTLSADGRNGTVLRAQTTTYTRIRN